MYSVRLEPSAVRDLKALSRDVQRRIAEALDGLAVDPRPPASKPLKGAPARWRLRVGEYRIVYRILDDAVLVLVIQIAHRSSVYKR